MFTGERAAELQGNIENFVHSGFHAGKFFLVALVAEDGGMQVAIAGMAEGSHLDIVLLLDLVEAVDHGRNLGARHCRVFQHTGGTGTGQGRQCVAAGSPELVLFFRIFRNMDSRGVAFLQHVFNDGGFVSYLSGVAVHLYEKHGCSICRQADVLVVFHVFQGGLVKQFQRTGNHMGGNHGSNGFGGVLDVGEFRRDGA